MGFLHQLSRVLHRRLSPLRCTSVQLVSIWIWLVFLLLESILRGPGPRYDIRRNLYTPSLQQYFCHYRMCGLIHSLFPLIHLFFICPFDSLFTNKFRNIKAMHIFSSFVRLKYLFPIEEIWNPHLCRKSLILQSISLIATGYFSNIIFLVNIFKISETSQTSFKLHKQSQPFESFYCYYRLDNVFSILLFWDIVFIMI